MTGRLTYVTFTGLRERGWTDGMVRELLGEPDVQGRDPRRWSVAPVRLFLLARVEAVERTPEFAACSAAAGRGGAAARAGAERRRQAVLAALRAEPIRVPRLPRAELERRAVRHRRLVSGEPPGGGGGPGPGAVRPGSPGALAAWQVDYLRHVLSRYDALLDGLFGATGRAEAERLLRERVYGAIARAYPWLAAECGRRAR
ncbi:hypothetical protein [Streptomyces ficellus]|uniref:Uncharacterized protein n=1 Tax=Streptomyces ficellus TaxID=1977088 RepID=A0A6I6F4M5_9ACTN|nr:hypothetical protein [Streptomyces ficellus]QGV77821.1 hypothetical protein EIZ62_05825 [Streptomyces ficellus]